MNRFIRQFGLILWKNYISKKRHWFISALEISLPIVVFLLVVILRENIYSVDPFYVNNPITFSPLPESQFDCQEFNLLYSPENAFTTSIIKRVGSDLFKSRAEPCVDELDMEVHLLTWKEQSYPNIFGIVFQDTYANVSRPNDFHYKIRPAYYFWQTEQLLPSSPETGPMEISDYYINRCFIKLQLSLDRSFILHSTNAPLDEPFKFQFTFQKFPYPPHIEISGIETFFNQVLPLSMIFSFFLIFVQLVKRIVEEKSTGAKELMSMMGMEKWMQWIGWLTSTLIFILVDLIFVVIFLKGGFHKVPILRFSDGLLIFIFLFLYCLASIFFIFVIAALFSKESIAIVVTILAMSLTSAMQGFVSKNNIGFSVQMLMSLFPNAALHIGSQIIAHFEGGSTGLQWANLWSKPSGRVNELAMIHVFEMLLVSTILCIVLVWYLDKVLPGKFGVAKPWYFPFLSLCVKIQNSTSGNKQFINGENERLALSEFKEQSYDIDKKPPFEQLPPGKNAGIKIRGVRKVFGGFSWFGEGGVKVAVDDVSLDILEGEITALLGHNGAGKTTLISILTGIYSSSGGRVFMGGYNIKKDMGKIRESLGLCPQHSMLFPELTVWEHLIFFSMSKGHSYNMACGEAKDLLDRLNLESKKDDLAKNLSGGMKRKLSVGIALAGKSKILILDEPTAGMDPDSRRQLWDLLLSMRGERTILLTTHYMEEADVLGDRIAIMDHGKVQCYGTSLFLKKVYGTGYHLTLLIDDKTSTLSSKDEIISKVSDIVQQSVPGSTLGRHTESQISYTMPSDSTDTFPKVFRQLDQEGKKLGVSGVSLNFTTLEEVFLEVGRLSEAEESCGFTDAVDGLFDSSADSFAKISGIRLYAQQAKALFVKEALFLKTNWLQLLGQGAFGVVMLIVAMYSSVPKFAPTVEPPLTFSLRDYRNSFAFVAGNGSNGIQAEHVYTKLLDDVGTTVKNVSWNGVQNALLDAANVSEGEYRDNFIVSASFSDSDVVSYFSTVVFHSCPTSVNLATTSLLRLLTNSANRSIVTTVHPFPDVNLRNLLSDSTQAYVAAFVWMLCGLQGLVIVSSFFTMLPTLEGASGARHLQLMAMQSFPSLFWIVPLLFDMFIFLLVMFITLMLFPIIAGGFIYEADYYGSFILITLMYASCAIPFAYLVSYYKSTIGSSQSFFINVNSILGMMLGIVVIVLETFVDTYEVRVGAFLHALGLLMPAFSATLGLAKFSLVASHNSKCSTIPVQLKEKLCELAGEVDYTVDVSCCESLCKQQGNCVQHADYLGWGNFSIKNSFFTERPEGVGIELANFAVLSILYMGLLYIIDLGIFSGTLEALLEFLMKVFKRNVVETDFNEDDDIIKEKERIDYIVERPYNNGGQDMLMAHNLKKNYGLFRWLFGGHLAVKGVSFGVDTGDCFGLLGANGAGKTSLFGMITGAHPLSGGASYVMSEKSRSWRGINRRYQAKIGYCPQFNATLGPLTGRQILRLYACLRGVPGEHVDRVVQIFINNFDLNEPADRPCKAYSGGNHRRLCTAISMMGDLPLVCLDEPTAGVDPVARRHLWDVLLAARSNGIALVLTSHSMEECEALCTKLAIMVNGRFVCIGTIPYLKSKFGQGFTLLVKLNVMRDFTNATCPTLKDLKERIEEEFPLCSIKDEHEGLLHYHIVDPKTKWSHMFSVMEELKESFSPLVEDYSISDTTLEQVFLSFVRAQREGDQESG